MDQQAHGAKVRRVKAGEKKSCEACGARLIMAAASNGGSLSPVELMPNPSGNVLLFRMPDGTVTQATLNIQLAGQLSGLGVPLRMNHFATCPQADRFRR